MVMWVLGSYVAHIYTGLMVQKGHVLVAEKRPGNSKLIELSNIHLSVYMSVAGHNYCLNKAAHDFQHPISC